MIEIVVNLCQNAVEALAESEGTLKITVKSTVTKGRDCLLLRIKDTGTGMKKKYRSRLGERGHSSGGEGLGLASWLAKTYVEKQGGTIGWNSKAGKGTTVSIVLPADDPTPPSQ